MPAKKTAIFMPNSCCSLFSARYSPYAQKKASSTDNKKSNSKDNVRILYKWECFFTYELDFARLLHYPCCCLCIDKIRMINPSRIPSRKFLPDNKEYFSAVTTGRQKYQSGELIPHALKSIVYKNLLPSNTHVSNAGTSIANLV